MIALGSHDLAWRVDYGTARLLSWAERLEEVAVTRDFPIEGLTQEQIATKGMRLLRKAERVRRAASTAWNRFESRRETQWAGLAG